MNITLKNFKENAALSTDSPCFTADVYVDGKKAGQAFNRGSGGATEVRPFTLEDQITAYAKTLPPLTLAGFPFEQTCEHFIDDLVLNHTLLKDMRRDLKARIVFTVAEPPAVFTTRKMTAHEMATLLRDPAGTARMLGADKILNFLPEAEALALYRRSGS